MNETLRRALLRAGISDEDIAARLQIDPKTVRRWLDGRLPYPRHRWALAGMLGVDEADLWPALRAARTRPAEVRAIYPRLSSVPSETWLSLFGTAEQEICILTTQAFLIANNNPILDALTSCVTKAMTRICLAGIGDHAPEFGGQEATVTPVSLRQVDPLTELIRDRGAETRWYGHLLYQSIFRADREFIVGQHAYGIGTGRTAALHLSEGGPVAKSYMDSFERIWSAARPVAAGPLSDKQSDLDP